jgi:hypothetical protein
LGDDLRRVGGGETFDPEDRERDQRVRYRRSVTTNAISSIPATASSAIVRVVTQPTCEALTSA